jgi:hypothetical protein
MKNLSRTSKAVVIAVSIVAVATALALAQSKPDKWGRVNIVKTPGKPDRILLFAPRLNAKEQKAFDQTLGRYDQKYYKIVTFKKGKKVNTRGMLQDMVVGGVSYSQVAIEADDSAPSDYAWVLDGPGGGGNSPQMVADMKKILARFTK